MARRPRSTVSAPEPLRAILERAGENRFARAREAIPAALWREAVGARIAERALPLSLEDGTLVECVADLAFRDGEEWVVVDVKTDAELADRAEAYRRQVALYVRGIAEATSRPARGHLLHV